MFETHQFLSGTLHITKVSAYLAEQAAQDGVTQVGIYGQLELTAEPGGAIKGKILRKA